MMQAAIGLHYVCLKEGLCNRNHIYDHEQEVYRAEDRIVVW